MTAEPDLLSPSKTLQQMIRYGIVGAASNGVGYMLYLGITAAGVEHKLAMTLLYAFGAAQTFIFNKRWAFRSDDSTGSALVRYIVVYALGYLINYAALFLLVDNMGMPHQLVMGGLVVLMTLFFFVAQKFWVFRKQPDAVNESVR